MSHANRGVCPNTPQRPPELPLPHPALAVASTRIDLRLSRTVEHRLIFPRVNRLWSVMAVSPATTASFECPEKSLQTLIGEHTQQLLWRHIGPFLVALLHDLVELDQRVVPSVEQLHFGGHVAASIDRIKLLIRNNHFRFIIFWNIRDRAMNTAKLSEVRRHFTRAVVRTFVNYFEFRDLVQFFIKNLKSHEKGFLFHLFFCGFLFLWVLCFF